MTLAERRIENALRRHESRDVASITHAIKGRTRAPLHRICDEQRKLEATLGRQLVRLQSRFDGAHTILDFRVIDREP